MDTEVVHWHGGAGPPRPDTTLIRLPVDAQPGAVVELYRDADGTMAAQVLIPAPEEQRL